MPIEVKPSARKPVARVHDKAIIDEMAANMATARPLFSRMTMGAGETSGVAAEMAGLQRAADLVERVKAEGYSHDAAYALLGQGAFRAMDTARNANSNPDREAVESKEIKVKSDGKRDRVIDRGRRIYGRETDRPASHWEGGAELSQSASLKPDAADTGRWFATTDEADGWVG